MLLKNLREEQARIDRTHVGGNQLAWCGNDCMVLSVFDQLVVIGPGETYTIDLRCRSEGMFCFTEPDGVRIVTSEHTYFLELVQDALK